jgi:hypothetical protein
LLGKRHSDEGQWGRWQIFGSVPVWRDAGACAGVIEDGKLIGAVIDRRDHADAFASKAAIECIADVVWIFGVDASDAEEDGRMLTVAPSLALLMC